MNAKLFGTLGGVAACCSAIILLLGGSRIAQVVKASVNPDPDPKPGHTDTATGIHFYNDDVQIDNIPTNNNNFGPTGYEDTTSGEYPVLYGELLDRMDYTGEEDQKGCDPNLMAAVAYATDLTRGTDILKESHDNSLKLGERPNVAAERLLKSEKDRQEVYDALKAQFESAEVHIEDLGAYTSQMYQLPTGAYFEDRPAITVKNTQHEGGHVLVFTWDDGKVLKLRLECGYQPTDTPEWEPPTTPPDNPPTTTTTTPPTTTEPPTTTTTLEPKDVTEAPPVYPDPDVGGSVRTDDIVTTPTPEPDVSDLPSSYTPPQPPTETKATTTRKTTESQDTPVTHPPATTTAPQVTYEDKTYTQAPPQVTNPPLEDVNDDAPTVGGNGTGVQSGTVPAGALDRFN